MDIHHEPIERRIAWLFELADRHGAAFRGPEAALARARYLAEHPTAIAVLKCMDGRIDISVSTRTPVGILRPFRNLGGRFDLGWPHLGEVLAHHVHQMVGQGRRVLIVITYHFSRGDPHRGCAGFGYDTRAAITHVRQIKRQVEAVFGAGHASVYPLVCGFETDEDALIVHGADDETLDLAGLTLADRPRLEGLLAPPAARHGGVPTLGPCCPFCAAISTTSTRCGRRRGAAGASSTSTTANGAICLGRGFDFLHSPNTALIIGPYSPDLAEPIRTAATIIAANMAHGRIADDGFLLLASAPFEEIGSDRAPGGAEEPVPGRIRRGGDPRGGARPGREDAGPRSGAGLAIADVGVADDRRLNASGTAALQGLLHPETSRRWPGKGERGGSRSRTLPPPVALAPHSHRYARRPSEAARGR